MKIQSVGYRQNTSFGNKSFIPYNLSKEAEMNILSTLNKHYVDAVPRNFLIRALERDSFSGISENTVKINDVVSNGEWLKKETLFNGKVEKFSMFQRNGEDYGYWFDDYSNLCRGENTIGPDYLALKAVRYDFPNNYRLVKYYSTKDASGNLNAIQFYRRDSLFVEKPVGEICNFTIKDGNIDKQEIYTYRF